MIEKIEDVKRPVKIGELYRVLCFVYEKPYCLEDDIYRFNKRPLIYPVFNLPHADAENGQDEVHYHLDYRFVNFSHRKYNMGNNVIRLTEQDIYPHYKKQSLERFVLPVIREDFGFVTPTKLINKAPLNHKCLVNGKCPHKGFDMSQVPFVNGVQTCPLHGLQFDIHGNITDKSLCDLGLIQRPISDNSDFY